MRRGACARLRRKDGLGAFGRRPRRSAAFALSSMGTPDEVKIAPEMLAVTCEKLNAATTCEHNHNIFEWHQERRQFYVCVCAARFSRISGVVNILSATSPCASRSRTSTSASRTSRASRTHASRGAGAPPASLAVIIAWDSRPCGSWHTANRSLAASLSNEAANQSFSAESRPSSESRS